MDAIDQANELADREREAILASRPRPTGRARVACVDCGDEIPLARRQAVAGVTRCAECQHYEEQRLRREGLIR